MNYLLDTQVFLWMSAAPERLHARTRALLGSADEVLHLSAASSWEMAIKSALGKLRLHEPIAEFIPKRLKLYGVRSLPITHLHAWTIAALPALHADPFDRMIIAQAQMEDLTIITADDWFARYPVKIYRADKGR